MRENPSYSRKNYLNNDEFDEPVGQSRRFNQTHQSNKSQERNERFSHQDKSKNKFNEREYRQR